MAFQDIFEFLTAEIYHTKLTELHVFAALIGHFTLLERNTAIISFFRSFIISTVQRRNEQSTRVGWWNSQPTRGVFTDTHYSLSLSNWVGFIHIYRKFTQLTKLIYSLIQIHFTLGYLVQPETGQVQGSRFALGSFTHTVRMHFSTFSWKVGKGELEICIESITIAHGQDHPSSPPKSRVCLNQLNTAALSLNKRKVLSSRARKFEFDFNYPLKRGEFITSYFVVAAVFSSQRGISSCERKKKFLFSFLSALRRRECLLVVFFFICRVNLMAEYSFKVSQLV